MSIRRYAIFPIRSSPPASPCKALGQDQVAPLQKSWQLGVWLPLIWSIMIGIIDTGSAIGQQVVIIKSRDVTAYDQAIQGFTSKCGVPISTYDLQGEKRRKTGAIDAIKFSKPNLVLAVGPLAAQLISDTISDIPIVFIMVANPEKYQLTGNQIAGISLDIPIDKQFDIYRSMVPSLKTLGALYDPNKTDALIRRAQAIAIEQGINLLAIPLDSSKEVPAAFRRLRGKIDAFWMLPDNTVITKNSFKFLLLQTVEHRLPFLAISNIFVKAGALASLSPNYAHIGQQACQLTQTILAEPQTSASYTVLPPSDIHLSINLKTAKKIGLILPQAMIESAHQVFQ